jgi:replicative DNA helicase
VNSGDDWKALTPQEFAIRFNVLVQTHDQTNGTHVLTDSPPSGYYEQHDASVEHQIAREDLNSLPPPHNLDAEAAVLSAVMNDRASFARIAAFLRPHHFYSESHRRIFEGCVEVAPTLPGPTDIVSVASWLRDHDRLAQVGGMAYMTTILNAAPGLANVLGYARTVFETWRKRELSILGAKLQVLAHAGKDVHSTLLEIDTLRDFTHKERANSHNIFGSWLEQGRLVHEPIELGLIDQFTAGGPVYGSRWYVLGAPDACKTAFIVQTADVLARRGIAVGVFAVDEESSDMQSRIIQRAGFERYEAERRDPEVVARMAETIKRAHPIPILYFNDDDTIESAAAELAEFAHRHKVKAALLIDSVQTVTCSALYDQREEPSEYVKVTRNVRAIRSVASRHNLIVLSTSEMNRESYKAVKEGEGRKGKHHMASGKQSGAIEYSARVMLSWEPAFDGNQEIVPNTYRVAIEKNKHGPSGDFFYVELNRQRMTLSHVPGPDLQAGEVDASQARERQRLAREAEKEATERARLAKEAAQKAEKETAKEADRRRRDADLDARLLAVLTPAGEEWTSTMRLRAHMGGLGSVTIDASAVRLIGAGLVERKSGPRSSTLYRVKSGSQQLNGVGVNDRNHSNFNLDSFPPPYPPPGSGGSRGDARPARDGENEKSSGGSGGSGGSGVSTTNTYTKEELKSFHLDGGVDLVAQTIEGAPMNQAELVAELASAGVGRRDVEVFIAEALRRGRIIEADGRLTVAKGGG